MTFRALMLGVCCFIACAFLGLSGCSNSNGGSSESDTPLESTPTVLGNTIYTDEVVTDGEWVVWEGRPVNFNLYDGSSITQVTSELAPEYNLGTDRDDEWRAAAFDGRYLVFMADNVLDANLPQLFALDTEDGEPIPLTTPGPAPEPTLDPSSIAPMLIEEPDFVEGQAYDLQIDDGLAVWGMIADDAAYEIFYYDFNAATPSVVQLTDDNDSFEEQVTVSNGVIAWVDGLTIYSVDLSVSTTPRALERHFSPDLLTADDGIFVWSQYNSAVSYSEIFYTIDGANAVKASTNSNFGSHTESVVVGYGTIAWNIGDLNFFHLVGDAAEEQNSFYTIDGDIPHADSIAVADGYIGYLTDSGAPYTVRCLVYDIEAGTTTQFHDFGNGNSSLVEIAEFGSKFLVKHDLSESSDVDDNPSSYFQVYDPATDQLVDPINEDYQRILGYDSAAGSVVWYGHGANRTLYAREVGDIDGLITITPPELNARQPVIDGGIVAFKGLDRDAYLALETPLEEGYYYQEIYYCDLNSSGRNIVQVTDNEVEDDKPSIKGDLIAWRNNTDSTPAYYDINSEQVYELNDYDITGKVAIDGDYLIWRNFDPGLIHVYNTTTSALSTIEGSYAEHCPSVADGLVVWMQDGTNAVSVFDLNDIAGGTSEIATADYWNQHPVTDGRFVVWGGSPGGSSDYPVYYYDMDAVTPAATELTAENQVDVCQPRLSDGLVVFAANEYGAVSTDGDKEIFYADLLAETPAVEQLTDNALWDSQPNVSNGVISWRTGGSSQWNWYGKLAAAAQL